MTDVLAKHAPSLVALEDLYMEYKFPRTALLMAHARGVICLAARQREVTVMALAPAEVKRTIAAHGRRPRPRSSSACSGSCGCRWRRAPPTWPTRWRWP